MTDYKHIIDGVLSGKDYIELLWYDGPIIFGGTYKDKKYLVMAAEEGDDNDGYWEDYIYIDVATLNSRITKIHYGYWNGTGEYPQTKEYVMSDKEYVLDEIELTTCFEYIKLMNDSGDIEVSDYDE